MVIPDLRENLCCSCDIPKSNYQEVVAEFEEHFPLFDAWSHMGTPSTTKDWFVHTLQQDLQQEIVKGKRLHPDFDLQEFLLKAIIREFPERLESAFNTYIRAERVKAFVRDYLRSGEHNHGKVMLVGHKSIFKFMTATKWRTHNEYEQEVTLSPRGELEIQINYNRDPIEFKTMANCEFYPLD